MRFLRLLPLSVLVGGALFAAGTSAASAQQTYAVSTTLAIGMLSIDITTGKIDFCTNVANAAASPADELGSCTSLGIMSPAPTSVATLVIVPGNATSSSSGNPVNGTILAPASQTAYFVDETNGHIVQCLATVTLPGSGNSESSTPSGFCVDRSTLP